MTLSEIQTAISARFDYSSTLISEDSEEWPRRLALINQAEQTLRNFLNGQWSFLLTSTTLSTVGSQNYVSLPSDYERGSMAVGNNGLLTINELPYTFSNYTDTLNFDTMDHFVWIKGSNAEGYKLYIQPTPADIYSIAFNYYTNQLAVDTNGTSKSGLSVATDVTKIPDPYFIVDWVIGELYLIDDEPAGKWQFYKQSAQSRLVDMAVLDGRDQNEQFTIKVGDEEDGFDIFNSNGDTD